MPSPFVILENSADPTAGGWLFHDPEAIIRCDAPATVAAGLAAITDAAARGRFAAGFLAYELGYLLEPRLATLLPARRDVPLLWFGVFRNRTPLDAAALDALLSAEGETAAIAEVRLSLDSADYQRLFRRVQDYLAAGDVYQINLTLKARFAYTGAPLALYRALRRSQPTPHGGVIAAEDFTVLSLSPELFFDTDGAAIASRPMKGTAPRGRFAAEDDALAAALAADAKSRAENLMITDLVRNDLGRIAETGSVAVPALYQVERYPTLQQMTSTVTARLHPGTGLGKILSALFPCGSVTGAPKIRAMQIIRELEPEPRGIYTGALGAVLPDGRMSFNVVIRSLLLAPDGGGEMGIGSGVVIDSAGADEYAECRLKARFLHPPPRPSHLIETLRWRAGEGFFLLGRHMARLGASAARFGVLCDRPAVLAALQQAEAGFAAPLMRVRVQLSADGAITISAEPLTLPPADAVLSFVIARQRMRSDDWRLFHKTSERQIYEDELARLQALTGCDEVVFLNERGEVTEGARSNVFAEFGGLLLTPPLASGLLDGTLRRELLETQPDRVREAVLTLADLRAAGRLYLGNSVRGLMPAVERRY
jgi:para-aminobenzoate synthetase/4-amino-4-deoxychorismate lyase